MLLRPTARTMKLTVQRQERVDSGEGAFEGRRNAHGFRVVVGR